jgi:hypothetical protein
MLQQEQPEQRVIQPPNEEKSGAEVITEKVVPTIAVVLYMRRWPIQLESVPK